MFSDEEITALDGYHYDWLDEAGWKAAFNQTHTLNVSGGSERATYFAGASYMNQGANLGGQDYSRFTYRAGVDIKLTSDVKLSASVSGNEGKTRSITMCCIIFLISCHGALQWKMERNIGWLRMRIFIGIRALPIIVYQVGTILHYGRTVHTAIRT